jgi:hypothetical protein
LGRLNGNIKKVWNRVDQIDYREGMLAYPRYNATLARLAAFYGAAFHSTVAAFCALSPNNDYMGNLRSLATLLKAKQEGFPDDNLLHVSTYNACRNRAWRFLSGENFLEVTKGKKTRSFYQNILDPNDTHPVTIDGHMVCVWKGQRMKMVEVAWSGFRYDTVANDFREFAAEMGLIPNQVQAVLWFTWKRINNVIFKPQMSLFSKPHDHWGLDLDATDITPFYPFI